jgi:2'-5' RNA ligase
VSASDAADPTARLFVALPVPEHIAGALAELRPPPGRAVRPAATADLHVTLHFLGQGDAAAVASVLGTVQADAFSLTFGDLGRFSQRGGRTVLYLDVERSAPLLVLHAAAARALGRLGFAPETRPYSPHVTLARLGRGAPAALIEAFLEQPLPAQARQFRCERFALYASEAVAAGGRYRVIDSFALGRGAAEPRA